MSPDTSLPLGHSPQVPLTLSWVSLTGWTGRPIGDREGPRLLFLSWSDVSASSVKVMPFANLMSLLGPSVDSVAVLRGIQKVAMLVQGNWVVKR